MTISRSQARIWGIASICGVVLLEAFNNLACHHNGLRAALVSFATFVAPPLVPALVCLALPNPLRAIGACALFAPWLVLAYYTDCVRPYSGGGASMIYVAVLLWGLPSAVAGAFIAGPVLRALGARVIAAG